MSVFSGMRGLGEFSSNELPDDWLQMIMFEYPNGEAPITALQSFFPEQIVKSSTYHWWTETMPQRSGAVTNIYIDAGLGTAYVYATHQATYGIAGGVVYVKLAEAIAADAVVGVTVVLADEDRPGAEVMGRVEAVTLNGASSYLTVRLSEADDNHTSASSYNLASVDRLIYAAPAYPMGSNTPDAQSYTPTEFSNNTQIHRAVFGLDETSQAEESRTGDIYDNDKLRLIYRYGTGLEWTAIFGQKYSTTDPVSKRKLKFTQGMLPFLRANNPSAIADYRYDTDTRWASKTWEEGGRAFLRNYLKILARFLPEDPLVICGDGALEGLEVLAEIFGDMNFNAGDEIVYGMKLRKWRNSFNTSLIRTHPLMSREDFTQNTMIFYVPRNAKLCPLVNNGINRSTKFETNLVVPGTDGTVDGFKGEMGWKFFFPNQWLVLHGIGKDNVV